jgi:3alpha(or 20beta)-hydroxysteroid dehydrogenase
MNIDLSSKVALVTGGAIGLGATIARTLAMSGVKLMLTDIDDKGGEQTVERIRRDGGIAGFHHLDVSDEAQWEAAIEATATKFGGLDILVNNAGIEDTARLTELELGPVRKMFDVNVIGALLGHKYGIRAMRPGGVAGKGGSIINLSSVAGIVGTPALAAYSATKGAMRVLTKAAAAECGQFGYKIRVNSIHPGPIPTAMGNKFVNDAVALGLFADSEAAWEKFHDMTPIGRPGEPQDIANAALFLASDLSSWMTGAELIVDGGISAI